MNFLSTLCSKDDFQRILNREDRWGLSPLDEIYRHKHEHIIHFLNQYLLNINQKRFSTIINIQTNSFNYLFKNWNKIYLFITLASRGQAQRIEHLFNRNYFLSTELYQDYHFRTPAHFAAANGHLNVIQILIQFKYIGLCHQNRWGLYPIDEAKFHDHQNIVQQLLQIQN